MSNFFTAEEPVFLVIAEPGCSFSDLVLNFLNDNSLNAELINLDQNFFLNYEKLSKKQANIYKIIFLYGFKSISKDVYLRVFEYLDLLNQNQKKTVPSILISAASTSLEILDEFDFGYREFLDDQTSFISSFINNFKNSMVFLGQDLLSDDKNIKHPLLLFFSALNKDYVFDLQSKFYFQDEKSFFNLIKEYLIKPHQQARFLIKGAALSSNKLSQQISYLCEQYFQKKMPVIKLIANEKKLLIFQEFSLVINNKSNAEVLIDKKIRGLVDSDRNKDLPSPSEEELAKALEISRLQKAIQTKKNKAQKTLKSDTVYPSLELSKQAHKEAPEILPAKNSSSEFASQIEKLFSTQRNKDKKFRQEKNIVQGAEIIQKSKKRRVLFLIGIFIFGISSTLLSLFLLFNFSQKSLQNKLYNTIKNNEKQSKNIDESISYWLFSLQLNQYKKLFSNENLSEALDAKKLSDVLSNLVRSASTVDQISYDIYKKTFEGGVELNQLYDQLLSSVDYKIEQQKELNAYLMNLNIDLYQGEMKEVWQGSLEKSKLDLRNSIQIRRFLAAYKEFILQAGKSNVLIVVQDSSEIRSSGGFLTEIFLLGFDKAVLVDKQIFNVSDLDSRVYGRKESPQDIKDLLGEENMFLHDSNWQADFAKSGQEMKWFVEQATGSKIDLVIALNSKTIREILTVFENLKINESDYVSADNYLAKQEELIIEDHQKPTEKKFTWQLANTLFTELSRLDATRFSSIINILINQSNQRELLLQSDNQNLQQAIEINSWSGKKIDLVCPAEFRQENCLLDSIFQVESNVGINKVNPYIKETVEHNLGISEKFIRHKRRITFENSAKSDSWPLGSYRNYLRFYLSPQANLEKIELNGQKVELGKIKIEDAEQGKEIAMLVDIPKQSKVDLTITYLVPNPMSVPFSYVFFDQKQPGIFNKNTTYNIVFDEQFKPQLIAPQATYQDKIIHFENRNLDNFLFAISFDE